MEMQAPMPEEEKTGFPKWLLVVLTILALAAIGGVGFLWFSNQKLRQTKEVAPSPSPAVEYEAEETSSDEVSSIEADLQETDLSGLDQELDDIEAEIASP